jgi:hypothetical protein
MGRIISARSGAEPLPDDFKIHRLLVNLGNAYVRRSAAERRNIMRAFNKFAFGKAKSASYWDLWS